ncbi:MAG: putative porin [Bacteroidia bacterium]|nr:putative porin [Bacteroidia bacterium]
MRLLKLILFLFFLTNAIETIAQNELDTAKGEVSYFLTIDEIETSLTSVDSVLEYSQIYIPSLVESYQNLFLGNIGTAGFELYDINYNTNLLNWGINHYDVYKFRSFTRKIYLDTKPFTSLEYLIGTKKEQRLRVTHQQHITNNMVAGIDFLTLASNGFYRRQLSKQRSFDAFYYFNTNNYKYKLLASYTSNKNEALENGGISNVLLFLNDTIDRGPEESDVNLLNAKSLNKDNNYFLKQEFTLLTNNIADSVSSTKSELLLVNTSNYSRNVYVFEESSLDTLFFTDIYLDSTQTYDSSFVEDITNKIELTYRSKSNSSFSYNVGLFSDIQVLKLNQNAIDTSFNSLGFGLNFGLFKDKSFGIELKGKYGSVEDAKGDYNVSWNAHYFLNNKIKADLNLISSKKKPSFINNFYDSNRFSWNSNLKDFSFTNFKVGLDYNKNIGISISNSILTNYAYFDTLALPQQFGGDITLTKIELSHKFSFKNIHYNGFTSYNKSNKQSIYPLPEIQLYHSIYYENKVLKVGIPIQVGFDFRYHTEYFALGYMPATGQRHLQTEQEIGDYLFIDFFLNFRINNSKMFFKVGHLNEGQGERKYFIMPNYPMAGRSFNLGVKWRFFD